jgi:tRNA pseudouridine55 synthase
MDDNLILIDKPKGITSFDVIRKLKRKYGIKKAGHAGTLDPLATGLLIVATGKKTKDISEYVGLPKVYIAEILIGISTDTYDMEGKVWEDTSVREIDEKNILNVLDNFVGVHKISVPIYSAVKVGGETLYKKARRGENVSPPIKEMEVFWINLLSHGKEGKYYLLNVKMKVSSGTYIRSLAVEIGKRLGYPACLKNLRRTEIGQFMVSDCLSI